MSCNEWREIKLDEIIEFNPKESISKGKYAKKINMDMLKPFYKYVNEYAMEEYKGGSKFRNGDTIMARITPCLENGKTAKVTLLNKNEVGFGSTEFIVLRAKEGLTTEDYVYYTAISPDVRDIAIKSMTGTSGRQRAQINVIQNININLPPLHEQKAIAKILSDLDEKIEINNRINKVLEEIAQTIFKRWFIDFEFPNENGEPYKSSGGEMVESELGPIPKGWDLVELGQFIEIINGYSYKSSELMESNTALLTIKNFDVTGNFKINGFKEIKISEKVKEKHYLELFDVVIACTDLTQNAEIIGNAIMVMTKSKYKKLIASMDIIKIVPKSKKITQYTLYMILKDNRF